MQGRTIIIMIGWALILRYHLGINLVSLSDEEPYNNRHPLAG